MCSGVNVIEYAAEAAAVIVRGFAVEPSAHFKKAYRVLVPPCGVVAVITHWVPLVQVTVVGVEYEPVGHPVPDTLNCAAMLPLKLTPTGEAEKFAVRAIGEFIVNVIGFAEVTMLPLHPVK